MTRSPRFDTLALHAGADITAGQIRITAPAGSPTADAVVSNDSALAALTPEAAIGSTTYSSAGTAKNMCSMFAQ